MSAVQQVRGKTSRPPATAREPVKRETPPVIVCDPRTKYPPEIFGRVPADMVLENQLPIMLLHWLKKARVFVDRVIAEPIDDSTDKKLDAALKPFNAIFEAILNAETRNASDVSHQMQAVVHYLDWFESSAIEEAISIAQFKVIAANLKRAVQPIQPKKQLGKIARGKRLTRAGLLFRYQSFLSEELHTLSYELYGEPRYAMQFVHFDDAVHKALKKRGRRRLDPFLDQAKLPIRAHAVLKSLKIDRDYADVRHVATKGGSR